MAAILPPPIAAACNVQMFILQPLNLNRFDFFSSTHGRSEGGEWLVDPLFCSLRCCCGRCGRSGRRCCRRDWLRVEDNCEGVFSSISDAILNNQTEIFFCLWESWWWTVQKWKWISVKVNCILSDILYRVFFLSQKNNLYLMNYQICRENKCVPNIW